MTVGYIFIMLWLHIGLTSFYPAALSLQSFRFAGSSLVNSFFSGASPPLPRPLKTKKTPLRRFFCFYGRDDWIRTSDPLHPMQMRYQTALHPDNKKVYKAFREEMQVLFFKNEKQIFYKLWKCKKSRNADATRGKIKKS